MQTKANQFKKVMILKNREANTKQTDPIKMCCCQNLLKDQMKGFKINTINNKLIISKINSKLDHLKISYSKVRNINMATG